MNILNFVINLGYYLGVLITDKMRMDLYPQTLSIQAEASFILHCILPCGESAVPDAIAVPNNYSIAVLPQ